MSYILTVTLNPCIDKTVTVEKLDLGGLNRATAERSDVGGKGINVSKVLLAMKESTLATGIAFGETGKNIIKRLDRLGIKNDFLTYDSGESRTNIKLLDKASDTVTEINGVGATVDGDMLSEFIKKYTSLLDGASLAVLAGSVPRGIPENIYETLVSIATQKGVRTIVDADGALLKNALSASPYMIKPNIFELSRLLDKEVSPDDLRSAANELLSQGINNVAISMGKDGSVFANKNEFLRVSAVSVTGGCATGAGDSMVAAAAVGIVNDFHLSKLARYASAAGSATASKEGTEVCTLDEILENVNKVIIK